MQERPPMTLWTWLRSAVAVLNYLVFAIGGCIISALILPSCLFGRRAARRWGCFLLHAGWGAMVFCMRSTGMIGVRLHGVERVKGLRGTVVVANHPSLIDVVLLVTLIPRSIPMAKAALRRWVFLRPILNCICLMNDEDPAALLRDAQDVLKRGYNLIIFPEGTRTTPGVRRPLHRGTARMAIAGGADILPVCITLSEPILSKETPWWYPGAKRVRFTVQVQPPLSTRPDGQEEEPMSLATRRLTRTMAEKLGLAIDKL